MSHVSVKKIHTFLGHTDSIYTLRPINESRFVSAGADGMIVSWDASALGEGEVIAKVPGSVYALGFDPTSNSLFIGQNNDGVHKIDMDSKKEVASIYLGNHQIFAIEIIDEQIWVGLQSGEVVIFSKELSILRRVKLSEDRIRSIHNFDNHVAIGASDHITQILDKQSKIVRKELKRHKNSVFSAKFHPTGKYLATVGRDSHINIWDTNEDYILRESMASHLYTINDIEFRSDGRYFATASMDKTIKLWDAYNFRLIKVLDKHRHSAHSSSVNKLLWMKSNDVLVSCSDDRTIATWQIDFDE